MILRRFAWLSCLLYCLLLAVSTASGQSVPERIKKKFEAGYPGISNMANVWPTDSGYFTLIMKVDSSGPGAYYWGMETVILNSDLEIVSRKNYGDTSHYYLRYSTGAFTVPDGKGNFWYWGLSYFPSDSSYTQCYGKFDQNGDTLFEHDLPNTSDYDLILDMVALPGGGGVISNQANFGVYGYNTVLYFIDSAGVAFNHDTIKPIYSYSHGAAYMTLDTARQLILVPTLDQKQFLWDHKDSRPRLFVYDYAGNRQSSRDYTSSLRDHIIGPLYRTADGRYFGMLRWEAEDSTGYFFGYQPGVMMLDSNFNFLWKRLLLVPHFYNIPITFSKGINDEYYLGGKTQIFPSDTLRYLNWFILKISPKFDSVWTRRYNVDGHDLPDIDQSCKQIVPMPDGRLLCLVTQFSGYSCSYLYMLDECGYLTRECLSPQPPEPDSIYPDPSGGLIAYPSPGDGLFQLVWDVNPGENCTLRVVDMTGRLLLLQDIVRTETPSTLDLRGLAAGTYFIEVHSSQNRRFLQKVAVIR